MVFFKIKVNACISIHLISYYNIWGIILKYLILLILLFFPYTSSNQFFFTIPHFFLSWSPTLVLFFLTPHSPLTPHFFGFCKRLFFMKDVSLLTIENYLSSSTSTYPTLDPLPPVIVATLSHMRWLDKRGHYMWWYFTCKHVSLF